MPEGINKMLTFLGLALAWFCGSFVIYTIIKTVCFQTPRE